ncbi:MAG TPA: hypothetical protein EYQ18_27930 [Candidatus Handelsmanbacteria bacterium]|nr:hypothetical protein [Candidatus Handelsmanbacteria bacterium]
MNARTYLQTHAKTRAQIDAFLKVDYQDTYDAKDLGWTYTTSSMSRAKAAGRALLFAGRRTAYPSRSADPQPL